MAHAMIIEYRVPSISENTGMASRHELLSVIGRMEAALENALYQLKREQV